MGFPSAGRAGRRIRWELYNARLAVRLRALDFLGRSERHRSSSPNPQGEGASELVWVPGDSGIEPSQGYVVRRRFGWIEASVPYAHLARRRDKRAYFSGVPSPWSLLRRGKGDTVDLALSLRHPFDANYFHVMTECMGAIALYLSDERAAGGTLIVGKGLAQTEVFARVIASGASGSVPWLAQSHRWVLARRGAMYVVSGISGESLLRTLELLERALPPRTIEGRGARLFLTRESGVGRNIRNEAELRRALSERGFRSVDPGSLPWPEQAELFRGAEVVVGVHGAAFTNILFRAGRPLRVVEIRTPEGTEDMYRQMSQALGFEHVVVRGSNPSGRGNRPTFDVDVDQVLEALDAGGVASERAG